VFTSRKIPDVMVSGLSGICLTGALADCFVKRSIDIAGFVKQE
jgi:hypothetical protein